MATGNPTIGFSGNYYYPFSTSIKININQIQNFDYSYPENPVTNYDFYRDNIT